jgi:hypothetical protein
MTGCAVDNVSKKKAYRILDMGERKNKIVEYNV